MEPAARDTGHSPKKRPFVIRAGKSLRDSMDRISGANSLIPVEPVLSPDNFPWTSLLSDNWQGIAEEAAMVMRHRNAIPPLRELSPDHGRLGQDGKWRSFFLVGYGYEVAENCARAPLTASLVRQIPDLNSAFFSILEPGATIPPHRGVTRGIVTCHLGLSVPRDADRCWMEVDGQRVVWRNGEWLIFDDCFQHQVANETDDYRVILLIQVKRPMRFVGRMAHNAWLWGIRHSPFVQDARRNIDQWEKTYRRSENQTP